MGIPSGIGLLALDQPALARRSWRCMLSLAGVDLTLGRIAQVMAIELEIGSGHGKRKPPVGLLTSGSPVAAKVCPSRLGGVYQKALKRTPHRCSPSRGVCQELFWRSLAADRTWAERGLTTACSTAIIEVTMR